MFAANRYRCCYALEMLSFKKHLSSDFPFLKPNALTVIFTNWKRPKNIRHILDTIKKQTIQPTVFLWNNGAHFSHPAIDWIIDSSWNMVCLPRWWMASCARSDAICIIDDDITFLDDRFLEDMLKILERKPPSTILGLFGVQLNAEREYQHCTHLHSHPTEAQKADIIKGRFMMMRTEDLRAVQLRPSPSYDALMADDIFVSGALSHGKKSTHFIPAGFHERVRELPHHDALQDKEDHWKNREIARRRAFSF